jgi:hypothetical protein
MQRKRASVLAAVTLAACASHASGTIPALPENSATTVSPPCSIVFDDANGHAARLRMTTADDAAVTTRAADAASSAGISVTPSSVTLTPAHPLAKIVVDSATQFTSKPSTGPCARLWITAPFGGPYGPGKLALYAGRADYAGDCFIDVQTPPIPSQPLWYGGAEIEYDLGNDPIRIAHGPFVGGGVTFAPHLVLLTKAVRSESITLRTKYRGKLPAVPPPIVTGIRPYGSQCHQNWNGIETSQNGLVVAPISYQGPRETFEAQLFR